MYIINLAIKVGTNAINSIFVASYTDRDEWQKGIQALMDALLVTNYGSHVDYTGHNGNHYAYITYEGVRHE